MNRLQPILAALALVGGGFLYQGRPALYSTLVLTDTSTTALQVSGGFTSTSGAIAATSSMVTPLSIQQGLISQAAVPAIRLQAYSPSIELVNKDATAGWSVGLADNDSQSFVIGQSYGPGQGVTPALRVDTGNNISTPAGGSLSIAGIINGGGLELASITDSTYSGAPGGVQLPYVIIGWGSGALPPSVVVRLNPGANLDIGTLAPAPTHALMLLYNVSSFTVTLEHNYTNSFEGILSSTGSNIVLSTGACALLWYDADSFRWRASPLF